MEQYFLKMGYWWGLGPKPGKKEMFVENDGTYTIFFTYFKPEHQGENKQSTGKLDINRTNSLKQYLELNAQKNYKNTVLDSGNYIEFKDNKGEIKIENDNKLWEEMNNLLPEFKSYT